MIETLVWILPRPRRKDKYVGGFPQWKENENTLSLL